MLRITQYFIEHPRIAHMMVFIIFVTGLFTASSIQREEFPPLGMDIMKITTVYPGASPEDVEINVTNKVEKELLAVENIKKLTSMSMENLSIVLAEVNTQAGDSEKTKRAIREAIQRVTNLPDSVTQQPQVEEIGLSNVPVLEVALNGDVSEHELRQIARELESRLQEISGVKRIQKLGYRKREIKIDVDLLAMKKNNISLDQIIHAVQSRNVRDTGGTIESFVSEKTIVTMAEYDEPLDVKDVIVRSNFDGYKVRISDLAEIKDGFEQAQLYYRGNGKPSIGLIITRQPNADSIKLSRELKTVINGYKKDLPEKVQVDVIYDYSVTSQVMLRIVLNNGMVGFVLVVLVMFLFLDLKSAFWSAFGIPFSILGAIILFPALGLKFHIITLMTMVLVLGVVVDDAIVIVERIYSLKQSGLNPMQACLEGVRQMANPVSAAVITSIVAFLPILFIPGIMGDFMQDIALVVLLVLSVSLIESLFFVPVHILHVQPPAAPPRRIRWLEKVKTGYVKALGLALQHRGKIISAFIVLIALILVLSMTHMKFVLDEATDEDIFTVLIEAQQGTALDKTAEIIQAVEKEIEQVIPAEVMQSYTTQVGHHDNSMSGISSGQYSHWGMITVFLVPAEARDVTQEMLMTQLEEKCRILKRQNNLLRIDVEKITGLPVGKAVSVTLTSNQDQDRYRFDHEIQEYLRNIPGVTGVVSSHVPGKAEICLRLDDEQMAKVGLNAMDVARTVRTAFDGNVVTSIRREGEDIDFRVRLSNPHQFQAQGVLELLIANPSGQLIKLAVIAHIEEKQGTAVLRHFRGDRSVIIEADVDSKVITSTEVNEKLRTQFANKIKAIPGLHMRLGGQEEEMGMSVGGFKIAFLVAILSIYFILVILFNSYWQPVLIMSIIPFAIVGVLITLMLHGLPLSFVSMIGMLGLVGVVVNDTIVMISHLNRQCQQFGKKNEVIVQAAVERFRPVILTSLTTFAALLPTSYGIGGDLPQMRPMALVMAWGLLFATMVTLGLIPILYSIGKKQPVQKDHH